MSYWWRHCGDCHALAPFVDAVPAACYDRQGQALGRKRVRGSVGFWEELRAGLSPTERRGGGIIVQR